MAHVLVVDQDLELLERLCAALRGRGIEAQGVSSGAEAMARLDGSAVDAVVCDGKIDLLAHVRRHHPGTPLILLIPAGTIDAVVDAMRDGAYDCVVGPIHPDKLGLLVERACSHQTLRRENRELRRQLQHATFRRGSAGADGEQGADPDGVFSVPLGRRMEEVERRYILGTLEMLGNNKARSAQVLGISKKTLYRRLHGYGIPLGPQEADSRRAVRASYGSDGR